MGTTTRILVLGILLAISGSVMAQNCFDKNFKAGQKAFNGKRYQEAKLHFQSALDCPDATGAGKKQTMLKIKECDKFLTASGAGNKAKPVSNESKTKPQQTSGKHVHEFSINDKKDKEELSVESFGGRPALIVGGYANPSDLQFSPELPYWIHHDGHFLQISPNQAEESRTFITTVSCRDCGNSISLSITQQGQVQYVPEPEAYFTDIRTYNEEQSTLIYVDCQMNNLKGREVRVYALFYQNDETTPLKDANGKWMELFNTRSPKYDESIIKNVEFKIDNQEILESDLADDNLKIYFGISVDNGKTWLDRNGPVTIKIR